MQDGNELKMAAIFGIIFSNAEEIKKKNLIRALRGKETFAMDTMDAFDTRTRVRSLYRVINFVSTVSQSQLTSDSTVS